MDDLLQLMEETTPPSANKQIYANSDLSGSQLEAEILSSGDALHATKLPNLAILHEKPEHVLIVYLKANGLTNREIAARTGYTEPWVSQVTRQPWFHKRLMSELKTEGRAALGKFLEVQCEASLETLVELRDDPKVSAATRATCAMNLVDRFLGKPVTRSEVKMDVSRTEDRMNSIQEELSQLEAEEKRLTVLEVK